MPISVGPSVPMQDVPPELAMLAGQADAAVGDELAMLMQPAQSPYNVKVLNALAKAVADAAQVMGIEVMPEQYAEATTELEPDLVRFLSMLYAAADDYGKPFPVELADVRRDADLTAITAHLLELAKDKDFEAFLDAPVDGEPEGEVDVDINIEAPDGEEVEEEADFDFGARMRPRG